MRLFGKLQQIIIKDIFLKVGINDNPQSEEPVIDLGKYLALLLRNKYRILLFSVVCTIVSFIYISNVTQTYTATATLILETEAKKAVSIEEVVGIDPSQKGYFKTQLEILKSRRIGMRVIEKLNLYKQPEFNSSLVTTTSPINLVKGKIKAWMRSLTNDVESIPSDKELQEKLSYKIFEKYRSLLHVEAIPKTHLVKIHFTSRDPKIASQIANAIGEAYIEENIYSRLDATRQTSGWISSRLKELRQELVASEEVLTQFLTENRLIDDEGIDNQISNSINELSFKLNSIVENRVALEAKFNTISNADSYTPLLGQISEHPRILALKADLARAEQEISQLSKRYGPKHDAMKAQTVRRDNVLEELNRQIKLVIAGLGKDLEAMKVQESMLNNELKQKKDEFHRLSVVKRQYEALKTEAETNKNILNVFLNRYKETTATLDFHSENARFTDLAVVPMFPSKPNKKLVVLISTALSLLAASAAVIAMDILRNTIESVKHYEERTGTLPLAGIPNIGSKTPIKSIFKNLKTIEDSNLLESLHDIKINLSLSETEKKYKTTVITSSLAGEGKTLVSVGLSSVFSQTEKTLLIDANLRNPSIGEYYNLDQSRAGWSNYLLEEITLSNCIFEQGENYPDILLVGNMRVNPQEVLSSVKFEDMISELESKYDRIIIDTPPTLVVNDSLIISKTCNNVVIVLQSNTTRLQSLRNVIAKFEKHEVNVSGVVINKINKRFFAS